MPFEDFFPLVFGALFFAGCSVLLGLSLPARNYPTVRKHLIHGPIAFLATVAVLWIGQQLVLVRRSEQRITEYVQHGGSPTEFPDFKLHLVLWSRRCGNANEGSAYALYGTTAAGGIDDPDPNVRARSLHATLMLCDFPDNTPEVRAMIAKAKKESDPVFHVILKKYAVAD